MKTLPRLKLSTEYLNFTLELTGIDCYGEEELGKLSWGVLHDHAHMLKARISQAEFNLSLLAHVKREIEEYKKPELCKKADMFLRKADKGAQKKSIRKKIPIALLMFELEVHNDADALALGDAIKIELKNLEASEQTVADRLGDLKQQFKATQVRLKEIESKHAQQDD